MISVDLYGQCADYDPLVAVCERYEVPLVEDAAEALGATTAAGRPAGSATPAVFSFNGNKIITTSGGGMLVTDDAALPSAPDSLRPRHATRPRTTSIPRSATTTA